MRLNGSVLIVATAVWLLGCASDQTRLAALAEQQRASAYAHFAKSDLSAALIDIRAALRTTKRLPPTSMQVVEAYDDAGLYFYSSDNYAQSARHQAIAVLLAIDNPALQKMLPAYIERLGWAWAKYRPAADFANIRAQPLRLLDDRQLVLHDDPCIRRHFYWRPPGPRSALAPARRPRKLQENTHPVAIAR